MYMLRGTFLFSIMSVFVKLSGQSGIPSQEIVLARAVVTLVMSAWMLRHAKIPMWGDNKKLLLARGLAGFGGLWCFYYAVTHLPLADATVIQYTNPVLTAVLAALVLREKLRWPDAAASFAALSGVVLVARPTFLFGGAQLNLGAVGIALVGACFSATAYVLVRKLRETDDPLVIVFYFPLVAVPASLPSVIPVAVWPQGIQWVYLLMVGITTQLAQVQMTRGLHLEAAGRATAISYVQILFAAFWGFTFFGELPHPIAALGALFIIMATLVVTRKARPR